MMNISESVNPLPIQIKIPTKETLLKLIKEEERRRFSKEYQDDCTAVKDVPNGWLEVTQQMQEKLVRDFGFDDDISCDIACNRLRRAPYIYPNDEEFKTIPVYVRENKANKGKLNVGDELPNVQVCDMDGNTFMLHDIVGTDEKKVNLLIASSAT